MTLTNMLPTEDEINAFCGQCDYRNQLDKCNWYDRIRYTMRNNCGWSSVNGIRASTTTREYIEIGQLQYKREDLIQIQPAAEFRKKVA